MLILPVNGYTYSGAKVYLKQGLKFIVLDNKNQILSKMHDRQRETLKTKVVKEGKLKHLFILFFE